MKPVWIVDDDQSIRWVLEKALERAGMGARSFPSGAELLEALEESQPSVLVTDVRMPGIDGLTLLHKVKEAHPDLPVIVMTAFTDLSSTVEAFQKGRSEEHTSELQSRENLVCRLLLEKKKRTKC